MAMVSRTFSMTAASQPLVKKKLKIKIAGKSIEMGTGTQSYDSTGSRSYDSTVTRSCDSTGTRSCDSGSQQCSGSYKRGSSWTVDGHKDKKRRLGGSVIRQGSILLKKLMTHPAGWIFNQPVDPVKLNIPDYFSIISKPMDLGTVKTRLEKHEYFSIEDFAADIRLTFSNAIQYNPPDNYVHHMAVELNNIFSTSWKVLEEKWTNESIGQACVSGGMVKNSHDSRSSLASRATKGGLVKSTTGGGCQRLGKSVQKGTDSGVRSAYIPAITQQTPSSKPSKSTAIGGCQRLGKNVQKGTDSGVRSASIPAITQQTPSSEPSKLTAIGGCQRLGKNVLKGTDSGVRSASIPAITQQTPSSEPSKRTAIGGCQRLGKNVPKSMPLKSTDSGVRSASLPGPAITQQTPSSEVSKCFSCGSGRCQCSLQNGPGHGLAASDLPFDRSVGEDGSGAFKVEVKSLSKMQMSKSATSTAGGENACSTSLPSCSASGCTPPLTDVPLSPKKALRAAMLKNRFAGTILKAQHKTLLDHGDKAESIKMQREKEKLEKQQLEETARIEAQIRAAEEASKKRVQDELKLKREKEREAARLALDKMEPTVQIDNMVEMLKDMEFLKKWSLSKMVLGPVNEFKNNSLERLGLVLKDRYYEDAIF